MGGGQRHVELTRPIIWLHVGPPHPEVSRGPLEGGVVHDVGLCARPAGRHRRKGRARGPSFRGRPVFLLLRAVKRRGWLRVRLPSRVYQGITRLSHRRLDLGRSEWVSPLGGLKRV